MSRRKDFEMGKGKDVSAAFETPSAGKNFIRAPSRTTIKSGWSEDSRRKSFITGKGSMLVQRSVFYIVWQNRFSNQVGIFITSLWHKVLSYKVPELYT